MKNSARWWLAAVLIVQAAFGGLFLATKCEESLREADADLRQRAAEAGPAGGIDLRDADVHWSPRFKLLVLAVLLLFCAVPLALALVLYRGTRLQRLAALAVLASWTVLFVLLLKAGSIHVPAELCAVRI